ncbi:uncharacterized protein LOC119670432 [Teleopsis dalmanni]|uniref:uncharacterized protein LOC119670432 n=1 Tax=Teleopsis dalmanni TaxID=139649 RepID=UPI0018CE5348|nr:uncharacterized protein LOC119670432 [Teleopsis dalmanni]
MQFLLRGTLLLAFFAVTIHGYAYTGTFSDPRYPGKCVIKNRVLSPGEVYKSRDICETWECYDAKGSGWVNGCGVAVPGIPNCELEPYDTRNKLHPECCPGPPSCKKG